MAEPRLPESGGKTLGVEDRMRSQKYLKTKAETRRLTPNLPSQSGRGALKSPAFAQF